MSTWKSEKEVTVKIDMHLDHMPVKYKWEYQTCADILSIHSEGETPRWNQTNEPFTNIEYFGPDTAKITLQAIANWMEVYHSKEELMYLLENNPFKIKET